MSQNDGARCYEDFFRNPLNDPFRSSDENWRTARFEDWFKYWKAGYGYFAAKTILEDVADRFRDENAGGIAVVVKDAEGLPRVRILHGIREHRPSCALRRQTNHFQDRFQDHLRVRPQNRHPAQLQDKNLGDSHIFGYLEDVEGVDGDIRMLEEDFFAFTNEVTVFTMDHHRALLLEHPTPNPIPPIEKNTMHTETMRSRRSIFVPFEMVHLLLEKNLTPREAFLEVDDYISRTYAGPAVDASSRKRPRAEMVARATFAPLLDFLRVAGTLGNNHTLENALPRVGRPFQPETGLSNRMRTEVLYRDLPHYREHSLGEERTQAWIAAFGELREEWELPFPQLPYAPTDSTRLRPSLELRRTGLPRRLCQQLAELVYPSTASEYLEKWNLAKEHQSMLPRALRISIDDLVSRKHGSTTPTPEVVCLWKLYQYTRLFLFGRSIRIKGPKPLVSETWHGPDCLVDSEGEIELAVRFFPYLLTDRVYLYRLDYPKTHDSMFNGSLDLFLASHANAVSFIPMLARLGIEFGLRFGLDNYHWVKSGNSSLQSQRSCGLQQLLCNDSVEREFGKAASARLDRRSLGVLCKLKEMGLIKREEVLTLIVSLAMKLSVSMNSGSRNCLFMESRLRMLIDWDPTILLPGSRIYLQFCITLFHGSRPMHSVAIRLFRTMLERAITHYPEEIGFVFGNRPAVDADDNFYNVRRYIGTETVLQLIENQLSRTERISKEEARQSMVFFAASNDSVSMDILYTLFRRDPNASLRSKTSHFGTKNIVSSSSGSNRSSNNFKNLRRFFVYARSSTYLGGSFAGGWQSNADLPHRRRMIYAIMNIIPMNIIRSMEVDTNMMDRNLVRQPIVHWAKTVEEQLYRSAQTKEAYVDQSTLRDRLENIEFLAPNEE